MSYPVEKIIIILGVAFLFFYGIHLLSYHDFHRFIGQNILLTFGTFAVGWVIGYGVGRLK